MRRTRNQKLLKQPTSAKETDKSGSDTIQKDSRWLRLDTDKAGQNKALTAVVKLRIAVYKAKTRSGSKTPALSLVNVQL